VLGDSVQNHGQLTDETTNNCHNGRILTTETVDINDFLENDSFLSLRLLNEFLVNLLLEVGQLLGAFGSFSVLTALDLGFNSLLLLFLSLLSGVIARLVVLGDSGLVRSGNIVDECVHQL
jgi:hypothetical protein